jgi:UDPglucose 6-dehydrogenase
LCQWLLEQGVKVQAHDPVVKSLPGQYAAIRLCASPLEAVRDADALVVATEWPDYRTIAMQEVVSSLRVPLVVDANGFLAALLGSIPGVTYVIVGKAV